MKKEELEMFFRQNEYLEGGTKEACVKTRVFLRDAKNPGNQLQSPSSCISANEFLEAVEVLMAFAYQQEDQIPERWRCDSDCRYANDSLCFGECNISKEAKELCPYFLDDSLK